MATHKSAIKRHRQSLKRRARNRTIKGGVRRAVKNATALAEAGEAAAAGEALQVAISRLDSAAQKGVMHKNTVARTKSRLTKRVNSVAAE